MEVVAVSHSKPRWLDIRGRRVHTSILHTPLTSPTESILVEPMLGVENNISAVHNAEVYVFFAQHYDYWCDKLDVPRESWDWCHWGENVTLRCPGWNEEDFELGDIWKIGDDAILQVCGSRVPCFKLAWRCGQKDSWLQALAATGKCGVYFKVIRGGRIRPGDKAELQSKRCHGAKIDCAAVTRAAFADAQSTRTTMNLLQDDPDLLDMNKVLFRRKLSMLYDQELVGKNRWEGWRQVCVQSISEEAHHIKSFCLGTPAATAGNGSQFLAPFLPGQFITVRLPNGMIRTWSLSSYPEESDREHPTHYRISIKKGGQGSTWMHENCEPGSILEIRAPSGAFCLDWSPQFPGRQIYMSAGIGITPLMAMFRAHLQHQAMQRAPAVWIHVARDYASIPFAKELLDLLAGPAAQELQVPVMLFLTGSSSEECAALQRSLASISDPNLCIRVQPGRPKLESLNSLVSSPYLMDPLRITPFEVEGHFSTVYICGTPGFEASMRRILGDLGVPEGMVMSESFIPGTPISKTPSIGQARVKFAKSNRLVKWKAQKSKDVATVSDSKPAFSLLELAEHAGLTPDYGCRVGVCGSCEVALTRGRVTGGLQPGGQVRICMAFPASEEVVVEL